ncbi:DUF4188 domain-containing protein [Arthrobacter sp.]|uniref:monooxygenase family protein n=1 Tax=Arthrobacter sp. TaxID=1667 RepID=UPI0034E86E88
MKETVGTGDVRIWHETYHISVKDQETVHTDMPVFGLAAATRRVAVGHGTGTARQRLGR